MALDWSKNISFSGLKKRAPKPKQAYPEKTYMNLMVVDKKELDLRRSLPAAIVIIVVVALFLKFGVFDFYAQVSAKQAELSAQQAELNALNNELKIYNIVLEEYEGYESMSISSEGTSVDAVEALSLIDRFILPSAYVSSLTLNGNTLTLNLTDITLDGAGKLVSALYEQDIVKNVTVATAANQQTASEDVVVAMTITLASSEEKEA